MALLTAYSLWQAEPEHWTQAQQQLHEQSPQQLQAAGERVQQLIVNELNTVDPQSAPTSSSVQLNADGSRTARITTSQINAWLSAQLPAWLSHRGRALPAGVGQPVIAVQQQQVIAAFELSRHGTQQVISFVLEPRMLDDGRAQLTLRQIKAGELPIPWESVLEQLAQQMEPSERDQLDKARRWIGGEPFVPAIRSPADRRKRIRVVGFELDGQTIEVTYVFEPT